MNRFNIKSKKGFTLIELLVVIGILAVLAAIMIPMVSGVIMKANVSSDKTNANEMTNSIERFASEYELYKQDIASGKLKDIANLDGAQGRVYNVTVATTRGDLEKLESEEGLNGRAIDKDTKYPTNRETARAIVQVYTKTSSSTFEPKQSDAHYYYSPDCGIVVAQDTAKSDVASLNALVSSGVDANGQPLTQDTVWIDLTEGEDAVIEKTYTLDEINADDHLFAIGLTKPEYVVAEFNDDYTKLTLTKNGDDSDGKIKTFYPWAACTFLDKMPNVIEVVIKEGITSLGAAQSGAKHFLQSIPIKSITIPSSVTSIENNVFSNCTSLKEINIRTSATSILSAFNNLYSTGAKVYLGKNFKSASNSFLYLGANSIIYCETQEIADKFVPNYNYTSSMTKIIVDASHFNNIPETPPTITPYKNYTIEEINSSEYLYAIGSTKPEYVVAEFNSDYTQVTIFPNGIGTNGKMTSWHPSIGKSPMQNHASTLKTAIIKEGVINIGDGSAQYTAFYGCKNLSSVSLPSTLTEIGMSAFSNCTSLTTITIPTSVSKIGGAAFSNSGLISITLPEKVKEIHNATFSNCKNLTEITLSSTTNTICSTAFLECTSLKSICLPKTVTIIDTNAFYGLSNTTTIYCETNTVLSYLQASKQEDSSFKALVDASKF